MNGASARSDQPSEPIPLSALQHAVYCLRQAALIHLERLWADNRFTAEGHVLHGAADIAGVRTVRGVRRVSALQLASPRLGIIGIADLVEFHRDGDGTEIPFPIEIKRGKPKLHRADEAQLCAQAFCLEDMMGLPVPAGALYYGETKRRTEVSFDADLRQLTKDTILALRRIFTNETTPPAIYKPSRCRACSLKDLCRPQIMKNSVLVWRALSLQKVLGGEATLS